MEKFKAYSLIIVVLFSALVLMGPQMFGDENGKIDLSLGLDLFGSSYGVENPQTDDRYINVANYLRSELLDGNVNVVESFAVHAFENKRRSPNGRSYFSEVLDRWFVTRNVVDPHLEASINKWGKTYPESPYAHIAKARYLYELGWKIRGSGWAQNVSSDRWPKYNEKLTEAWRMLKKSQKIKRDVPASYELAMAIVGQIWKEDGKVAVMDKLLETAKSQNVYDLYGTTREMMLYGYSPRWGGDAKQMLNFAREAARDAPADSLLPLLVAEAHQDLANLLPEERRYEYYERKGVWEEVQYAYERILQQYPRGLQWMVDYAEIAFDAGQTRLTADLLNKVRTIDPEFPALYKAAGAMYLHPDTFDLAEKSYKQYMKLQPKDEEPFRQLAWIRLQQGNYTEAMKYISEGLQLNNEDCLLLAHSCLAKYKMNMIPDALGDCERALNLNKRCTAARDNKALIDKEKGLGLDPDSQFDGFQ